MPVLKYRDPADGVYRVLSNKDEVTVSAFPPPVPTDLWVNTADNSGGIPLTARNVIRNGDMQIYQRGNGPFTNLNSAALIDGYWSNCNGGTFTINRVPQAVGAGSALIQCQVSGHALASHYAVLWPYIEGVETLAGKIVTLSFDAFALTGTPQIGIDIQQYFGSGGSASLDNPIGRVAITQTKTRYSITFTMPSVTGKTVGANNCIYLGFYLSAGADYAIPASSIGIQNNTFSLTDIQLEEGSVATPFERLPIQQQLAWCQRYYARLTGQGELVTGYAWGGSGDVMTFTIRLPVMMRAAPTVSGTAPSTYFISNHGGATFNSTNIQLNLSNRDRVSFNGWVPQGTIVQGYGSNVGFNASGGYIEFSAEL